MFRSREKLPKPLLSEAGKVVNYTWAQILKHLTKSSLNHNSFSVLEVVFFHPVFPNRPQELCSQNNSSGVLLQDVRDLSIVDVIRGCTLVASSQSGDDGWSGDPVSIAIKDGKYVELDLMALTRLQKLFPAGTTAVVFAKVAGKRMRPGVFVHEIKRGVDLEKDEIRAEGVGAMCDENHLRECTWAFLKVIELQLQSKCIHFTILYKLPFDSEEPYIADVLKCVARPFSPQKLSHHRSSSHQRPPLSVFMHATNPWKSLKAMKLQSSLRSFVVNPSAGVIIHPKDLPRSQESEPSAVNVSATSDTREPPKRITERPSQAKTPLKAREKKRVVRKRLALPLIRREEAEECSMELHGTAFPWRHTKLDLTIA